MYLTLGMHMGFQNLRNSSELFNALLPQTLHHPAQQWP